ncbi:MAG: LUD domain-containing protein [Verrucomicrobiota bacterium]|nr:LUD domain-containing protein [Verrucomicrobiota bacterium]
MSNPSSTDDRAAILERIREALREPAPRHHEAPARAAAPSPVTAPFREWLPPVGEAFADQLALFAQQAAALKAEFKECEDLEAAGSHLESLAREGGWKRVGTHAGSLLQSVSKRLAKTLDVRIIEAGYDKDDLEACDAGITECEALIAQTGSICVTSLSSGGRALSVLPPHHVALARRGQLLPDLSAAYEFLARKYRDRYPSFVSFISGPSRTGDIERILVLGAHGPRKLTILLVP